MQNVDPERAITDNTGRRPYTFLLLLKVLFLQ